MGRYEAARAALDELAEGIGGPKVRTGRGVMVRCVVHADRSPSLHLSVGAGGRLLVRCFAGCSGVEVLAALRRLGVWPGVDGERQGPGRRLPALPPARDDAGRREAALAIWRQARPAAGTPVEAYLRSRGITLPPSPSLRFHPRLAHKPSGRRLPAMVAAVQAPDGQIVAVHRTYLRPDGGGKADVAPVKMSLAPTAGAAVRLAPASHALHVAEGIETASAAMQATGAPTWAALSATGLAALLVPDEVGEITILADGDLPGEQAAQAAAARWCRTGRIVRIARPPTGTDFNDLLLAAAS